MSTRVNRTTKPLGTGTILERRHRFGAVMALVPSRALSPLRPEVPHALPISGITYYTKGVWRSIHTMPLRKSFFDLLPRGEDCDA